MPEYKVKWTTEADLTAGDALLEQQKKLNQETEKQTDNTWEGIKARVEAKSVDQDIAKTLADVSIAQQDVTGSLTENSKAADISTSRHGALYGMLRGLSREFPILGVAIKALSNYWVWLGAAIAGVIAWLRNYEAKVNEIASAEVLSQLAHKEAVALHKLQADFENAVKALGVASDRMVESQNTVAANLDKTRKAYEDRITLINRLREANLEAARADIAARLATGELTPEGATRKLAALTAATDRQKAEDELAAAKLRAQESTKAVTDQEAALATTKRNITRMASEYTQAEAQAKAATAKTGGFVIQGPTGLPEDKAAQALGEKQLDLESMRAVLMGTGYGDWIGTAAGWITKLAPALSGMGVSTAITSGLAAKYPKAMLGKKQLIDAIETELAETVEDSNRLEKAVKARDKEASTTIATFEALKTTLEHEKQKVNTAAADLKKLKQESIEAQKHLDLLKEYLPGITSASEGAKATVARSTAIKQAAETNRSLAEDAWRQITEQAPMYATPEGRQVAMVFAREGIEGVRAKFPRLAPALEQILGRFQPPTPELQRLKKARLQEAQEPGEAAMPPFSTEAPESIPYSYRGMRTPRAPVKPEFGWRGPQTPQDYQALMKYFEVDMPAYTKELTAAIATNSAASANAHRAAATALAKDAAAIDALTAQIANKQSP